MIHNQLLHISARSPIYSHLSASLTGLTTIRSFGAQPILIKEFDKIQDNHSSAFYLFISTSRAFGFWLDIFCVMYIAVVTISFFIFGGEGGNVGLAITQALAMTGMVQWGMRQVGVKCIYFLIKFVRETTILKAFYFKATDML